MGQAAPVTGRGTDRPEVDAVVVGAGPNGLAAAIELARNGRSVLVLEAEAAIGGGCRSGALTLPGFVHDLGSAIHPLGVASPFFRRLPLADHGLAWIEPPAPLAHPFDDGTAAVLERSLERTAASLGADAAAYRRLMGAVAADADRIAASAIGPRRLSRLPRHPLGLAVAGWRSLGAARAVAEETFGGEHARGLFAGNAAHSFLPLDARPSAGFGLALGALGHAVGWPFPKGGSQALADALVGYLRALGGEVRTGVRVRSLADLPPARAVLFDLPPRRVLEIAGERLPGWSRWWFRRYRPAPGVFKLDYALDGPIPWAAEGCRRAGTVHLGGTLAEIAAGEATVAAGGHPARPFVLLAQQSLFDPSRAPLGKQTVWAYCHVPNGSTVDMAEPIEAQIERFAPGFRDRVLHRTAAGPAELERQNANLVGGDINGGRMDLRQLLFRPAPRLVPWATGAEGLFLCSASTPPGGGVHGMGGYWAARAALRGALRDAG